MKDSGFGCLRETGTENMRTATKKRRINSGSVKFREKPSGRISVFCLSDSATAVNISGLKYQAVGASLSNMFPIGVSNEFIGGEASVSLSSGILGIIWDGVPDDITVSPKRD